MIELRRNVEVHKMNGNDRSIEETVSWVRSERVLKIRATKSVNLCMRNITNARVN